MVIKKVGIVGSKIYYADTKLLWFAGGSVNPYIGTSKMIGIEEEDKGQYDEMKEVDFIVGCSMLFSKEVIEFIGYLEEDYFIYYEDTDWNLEQKRLDGKSFMFHHPSSTIKNLVRPNHQTYLPIMLTI